MSSSATIFIDEENHKEVNIFVKNLENKNCLYPILNNLNYIKLKKLKENYSLDFSLLSINC